MLQRKAGIDIFSNIYKSTLDGYAYVAMIYARIEQTSPVNFDPDVMKKLVDLHVDNQVCDPFPGGLPFSKYCPTCRMEFVPCKTLLLLGEALEVEWDWSYVHTLWDEKRTDE